MWVTCDAMRSTVLRRPRSRNASSLGDLELIDRRAELKTLRPFGPAARGVFALDGEDRRALRRVPALLQAMNFFAGER